MYKHVGRTWKSQDVQAEQPLSWCRLCGKELYRGMKQDGYCALCRREVLTMGRHRNDAL